MDNFSSLLVNQDVEHVSVTQPEYVPHHRGRSNTEKKKQNIKTILK